jgi:hypothetical protein
VSGEKLEFAVQIFNNSYRKIYPLKIFLVEKMTYFSRGNGRHCDKNIKTSLSNNTCIEPLQNYEWNDTSCSFILPQLLHSSSCRIMLREYYLLLEVSPVDSLSFSLKIPITIGNLINLTSNEKFKFNFYYLII